VRAQPIGAVGAEALDRGLRDRAVRSLDLAVCPWISAARARCRRPRGSCRSEWMVFRCRGRSAKGLPFSVRDPTGHSPKHVPKKRPGGLSVRRRNAWGDREPGRPVNAGEKVELALRCLHHGDTDAAHVALRMGLHRIRCMLFLQYNCNGWRGP